MSLLLKEERVAVPDILAKSSKLLQQATTQYINNGFTFSNSCEPVWPSGKAIGWKAGGPWLDSALALLSLKTFVACGHVL